MRSSAVWISLLIAAAADVRAQTATVVKASLAVPPQGFKALQPADADTLLPIKIGLVSSDIEGLKATMLDVSTPSSANYGKFLSKSQVEAFVQPNAESVQAVTSWLASNGLKATVSSPAGDWLSVDVPVSKANQMLSAHFTVFEHQETGRQTLRTLSYAVPEAVAAHIAVVHPTTSFPNLDNPGPFIVAPQQQNAARDVSPAPASCAHTITPECLQELYQLPLTSSNISTNTLGVFGYSEQFANKADLQTFLKLFRPQLVGMSFAVQSIDDGNNSQVPAQAGSEANLDIQTTVSLAAGVPITFLTVGDGGNSSATFEDELLGGLTFLLGLDTPPLVTSTSYSVDEAQITLDFATKMCDGFMQLGARGVSMLFSSGDGGAAGRRAIPGCTKFGASFPSVCPFVTSVGATTGIGPGSEVTANFSSGAFSNFFARPSYQNGAVTTFLNTIGNLDDGRFNRTGRGVPDISAQGQNYSIVVDGATVKVSGTSCSTPAFASVIALLNSELLAAGKKQLGFLNPFLYAHPGALNDVTLGSNPGCNTTGFPAVKGWDPATGLGTPNFPALRTAVGLA